MTDAQPRAHDFLHDRCDARGDSDLQRKFRALRPWPCGVVFIQRPEWDLDRIRQEFRTIRALGFTCLKQFAVSPGVDERTVMRIAIEEGVSPWWFDDAVAIAETDGAAPMVRDAAWHERHRARLLARAAAGKGAPLITASEAGVGLPGTVPRFEYGLPVESAPLFTAWLRERYGSVAALTDAWNFAQPFVRRAEWSTWEQVEAGVIALVNGERQEYRRITDVLRFRADRRLVALREECAKRRADEPELPVRAGGEMSLFLPHAAWSVDFAGTAQVMRDHGSVYPSLHPTWHFEEVAFELVRPSLMQAGYIVDVGKGVWTAPWEAVGGPQIISGGKAHLHPPAQRVTPGSTIARDGGTTRQILLGWLAQGARGFGLWAWNGRAVGWEAGESALCELDGTPGPRARAAGQVAAAGQRLRDELWQARKEPLVGIFSDFDHDVFWAAASIGGRDHYKEMPARARIGAARICLDANIPYEHVTAADLRAGLAARYRTIFLPAQFALGADIVALLTDYVAAGGRVVLDAPGGWFGTDGRVMPTQRGSAFQKLFGVRVVNIQYGTPTDRPWTLRGERLTDFALELEPQGAAVAETFAEGGAAVTVNRHGRGEAVVVAHELALACLAPGASARQRQAARWLLGAHAAPYRCDGALCLRLAAPAAGHYVVINDGPAQSVYLVPAEAGAAEDVLTGAPLDLRAPLALPGWDARWIRVAR